ncbi:MAG TPA: VacJ family lipoprotein [Candidatus Kryptonia bacterium]|nr:VacJ family lipoprotein [Candidatus Kryptonia bacterium]
MAPTSILRRTVAVVAAAGIWCAALAHIAAADSTARTAPSNHDPIEPFNRAIFWFNDQIDTYVLVPVAKGYDKITPNRVKQCLSNFFTNLRFPLSAGNDLLQGKLSATASDVGRFAVNTTVGLAGFFDPATDWGLVFHDEDFGQTLGYWGVPAGPYLVLPFWGPSNIRDGVGLAGDAFSTVYPWFIPFYYSIGAQGVRTINGRSLVLREVEQLKEASVDYYSAVRNAYGQRRQSLIEDRTGMSQQEQEDLYNVETNGGE